MRIYPARNVVRLRFRKRRRREWVDVVLGETGHGRPVREEIEEIE
jgi:hypothetical protein